MRAGLTTHCQSVVVDQAETIDITSKMNKINPPMMQFRNNILSFILLSFVSCAIGGNDTKVVITDKSVDLIVRLDGVGSTRTRAVESQGSTSANTIVLENGHIFVVAPDDTIIRHYPLNVKEACSAGGQLLGDGTDAHRVSTDVRIFILGNLPAGMVGSDLIDTDPSLGDIIKYPASISTQSDYKKAVLSNSNGLPAAISARDIDGTTASVTVSLKPVISRLELVSLQGSTEMTSFTVTGVFLDSYYPSFTFGAGYSGDRVDQGRNPILPATTTGDRGTWPAERRASGLYAASPSDPTGTKSVWAYNVAAGSTPRLLVRLSDIKYEFVGTAHDLTGQTRFLTVVNYTGLSNPAFERGRIYRIEALDFDWRKLSETPNPPGYNLSVSVEVEEWEVVSTDAEIF